MSLRLAAAVVLLLLSACNQLCVGTACACPKGQTCVFDGCTADTPGCQLDCAADSNCRGACGQGCQLTCGGASCNATLGPNSQVTCTSGTCSVTCQGTCSTAAQGGTLTLTCANSAKTVAGCQ